jgi:hypothetical protein
MSSGLSATDELLEKQKREHREMQKQSSSKKPSDFLMNMPLEKEQAETGEETIDLNYRLICKDCKKIPSNVVENYKAGDYVCGDCGLVFPMRIIDMSTEWRNFSNDTGAAGNLSMLFSLSSQLMTRPVLVLLRILFLRV